MGTSGPARVEDAASVYLCAGTPVHYEQTARLSLKRMGWSCDGPARAEDAAHLQEGSNTGSLSSLNLSSLAGLKSGYIKWFKK